LVYDSLGRLTRVSDPLNHQTTFTYTGAGQPLTVTQADKMTGIISHLESHLGPIQEAWRPSLQGSPVQAVRFKDQPMSSVDTFATLGLSQSVFTISKGRQVRQELILPVFAHYPKNQIASFLTTFGEFLIGNGRALLRGDVVGPSDSLIPGVRASAIYSSIPVLFDESLATYQESDPATVIVWLVPLVGSEPEFIRRVGWERFEDELERRGDTTFWDLDRDPVV
jgi:YD repeat-containing protein